MVLLLVIHVGHDELQIAPEECQLPIAWLPGHEVIHARHMVYGVSRLALQILNDLTKRQSWRNAADKVQMIRHPVDGENANPHAAAQS